MALSYATHHTKAPDWDRKCDLIDTFSIGSSLVSSKASGSSRCPSNCPSNDSLMIRLNSYSSPVCQSLRGILMFCFDLSSTTLTRWPKNSKLSKCAGASDNSVDNFKLCRKTIVFWWNDPCWTLSGKPKSFSVLLGCQITGWLNQASSPSFISIIATPQNGWMMRIYSGPCCTIGEQVNKPCVIWSLISLWSGNE